MNARHRLGPALVVGALTALLVSRPASAQTDEPVPTRPARAPRPIRTLLTTDALDRFGYEIRLRDAAARAGESAQLTVRTTTGRSVTTATTVTFRADGRDAVARGRLTGLAVTPWSPQTPTRYDVLVAVAPTTNGPALQDSARIGFRTVAASNGRVLLNGRPVFLKGNAINPPGRNIPDSLSENPHFAREYLRGLKAAGVNLIRLGSMSEVWLDAADDVGMLVFQGHYGVPRGGTQTRAPADLAASVSWYKNEVLAPQVNHPSVIIYALANEVADAEIHYASEGAAGYQRFLAAVYDSVNAWDPTRLIMANAGYGFGRVGEVCDLHRYWGWYYNSFLSFYTLRDPAICWRGRTGQPITLSEVVGNYTSGDGRFNLVSDTKQPDSQLNWTGHAPEAEQSARALGYQAWMAQQAIEITRRLRAINPNLAGLSPFTIVFSQWHGITTFADMRPKPIVAQYARSYQPVLLSWELWTPQRYAGATITATAHVVNDTENGAALPASVLVATLRDASGRAVVTQRVPVAPVPYYATAQRSITVPVPVSAAPGRYTLEGVLLAGRDTLSRNTAPLQVFAPRRAAVMPASARALRLYDPPQRTARALRTLGIVATPVSQIVTLDPAKDALLVGRDAWDAVLTNQVGLLEQFVARGGRVLILDQDPGRFDAHWLPGGVRLSITALDHAEIFPGGRPWAQGMAINVEAPQHTVFADLTRDDLFLMDDYTGWQEARPGFPAVYPVTRGYALTRPAELGRVRVLANYDHGLMGVALAEFFGANGNGSTLLSGFDLVPRVGLDPVADRLLTNLVRYVVADPVHEARPVIADTLVWGSYDSERGLLTGVHSGLLLNTVPTMPEALRSRYPTKIDADGFWVAGDAGGWNTRPAVQYVAQGRRPFGPYEFTSGGSYRRLEGAAAEGEGRVWWRVPAGRTVLSTRVDNPVSVPLDLTVAVNDSTVRVRVAPQSSQLIEVPLRAPKGARADAPIPVAFVVRGDPRLVLRHSVAR